MEQSAMWFGRYSATISACEKGKQWADALSLLVQMREAWIYPDVVACIICFRNSLNFTVFVFLRFSETVEGI